MNPVTLYHIDPIRNMQRFYRLDIQPDLFGNYCFIREWGRIGQAGQMQMTSYQTEDEAQVAFCKQQRAKERKGYDLCSEYSSPRPNKRQRLRSAIG